MSKGIARGKPAGQQNTNVFVRKGERLLENAESTLRLCALETGFAEPLDHG